MELLYEKEVYKIIGAAIEVHRILGPGFAEAIYHEALEVECQLQQVPFVSQKELRVIYKGSTLNTTTALTEVERNGGRVSAADGDDNNFGERVAVLRVAIRTKPGAVWVNERVRARQFQASV